MLTQREFLGIPVKCALLAAAAMFVVSTCPSVTVDDGLSLSYPSAFAEDHGSGHSGGGAGSGKGKGNGKGPNPACPYKDGSGRGAYAGNGHGGAGQHGKHHSDDDGDDGGVVPVPGEIPAGNVGTDDVVSGGAGSGESFVCDGPPNWHATTKIYMNE